MIVMASFNPCFSGTTTQTCLPIHNRPQPQPVSILVFLEPLLRLLNSQTLLSASLRFNPCFSGTTTQTWPDTHISAPALPGFNPCFSGTTTQTIKLLSSLALWTSFQSLFFWNHYLDSLYSFGRSEKSNVSILVFLEPLLRLFVFSLISPPISQFQSLFFWNHYLDLRFQVGRRLVGEVSILVFLEPLLRPGNITSSPALPNCFNPCFSGTTTQTLLFFLHSFVAPLSFNPCFSGTTTQTDYRIAIRQARWSFNPCFSGTTTQTIFNPAPSLTSSSFNPCFSGTTTQTNYLHPTAHNHPEFQSLFFWNHYLDQK